MHIILTFIYFQLIFIQIKKAFVAAVDWTEKWIQALIVCQVILWIVTILTRKWFLWQSITFFFICIVVGSQLFNTQVIFILFFNMLYKH